MTYRTAMTNLLIHQLEILKETNPQKFAAAKQVLAALTQAPIRRAAQNRL
jgi:hypothetical protein